MGWPAPRAGLGDETAAAEALIVGVRRQHEGRLSLVDRVEVRERQRAHGRERVLRTHQRGRSSMWTAASVSTASGAGWRR